MNYEFHENNTKLVHIYTYFEISNQLAKLPSAHMTEELKSDHKFNLEPSFQTILCLQDDFILYITFILLIFLL